MNKSLLHFAGGALLATTMLASCAMAAPNDQGKKAAADAEADAKAKADADVKAKVDADAKAKAEADGKTPPVVEDTANRKPVSANTGALKHRAAGGALSDDDRKQAAKYISKSGIAPDGTPAPQLKPDDIFAVAEYERCLGVTTVDGRKYRASI